MRFVIPNHMHNLLALTLLYTKPFNLCIHATYVGKGVPPDSCYLVDESHLELFNGYSIDAYTVFVCDDSSLLLINQNSLP